MTAEEQPILQTNQLHHAYGQQTVLNHLTVSIPKGQLVCVLGASGCGKSTFLRLVAGLESAAENQLTSRVDQRQCGFVFQQPNLLPWRSVLENVALPLQLRGQSRSRRRQASLEQLEIVGLSPQDASKWPRMLSGGMQMRASLARTLITQPQLLLFDEPFSALDEILRQRLNEDLRRWHLEYQWTTLFVTHNVAEAVFLADRILVFRKVAGGRDSLAADLNIELPQRTPQLRDSEQYLAQVASVSRQFREITS